jgi:hypothetical protein
MPHPAYSPDLAPGDFLLFGFLKEKLPEYRIADRESRKSTIMKISVATAWIERLKWAIKHNGEYFHK